MRSRPRRQHYRRWTDDEAALAHALFVVDGIVIAAIKVGRSPESVEAALRARNMWTPRKYLPKWSRAEIDHLYDELMKGLTYGQIAMGWKMSDRPAKRIVSKASQLVVTGYRLSKARHTALRAVRYPRP